MKYFICSVVLLFVFASCSSGSVSSGKSAKFVKTQHGTFTILKSSAKDRTMYLENEAGFRVQVYQYLFNEDKSLCCYYGMGEIVILSRQGVIAKKQEIVVNGVSILPTKFRAVWTGKYRLELFIPGLDRRTWILNPNLP